MSVFANQIKALEDSADVSNFSDYFEAAADKLQENHPHIKMCVWETEGVSVLTEGYEDEKSSLETELIFLIECELGMK